MQAALSGSQSDIFTDREGTDVQCNSYRDPKLYHHVKSGIGGFSVGYHTADLRVNTEPVPDQTVYGAVHTGLPVGGGTSGRSQ